MGKNIADFLEDIDKDAKEYENKLKASGVTPNQTISSTMENGVGINTVANGNIHQNFVSNLVHGITDTGASAVDLAAAVPAMLGNQSALNLIGNNEASEEY